MQNTTNYNLNLPEGTDVVNPLVDYNPNFSTIDSVMKANSNRTVGRATCIKSGTTHVVTRSNTDSPIINFTATGDWNEGDTMTIDSTIVSVFLPDGTAAPDGAYLINTEVFGILNGTRFTLYSNVTDLSAIESTKADKADIGTVETGTTASRAYSIGELVYISGSLYRVKTAIASGATFTVGANVELATVSDAIQPNPIESGVFQVLNPNITIGSTYCKKIGKCVTVSLLFGVSATITSGAVLQLPWAPVARTNPVINGTNSNAILYSEGGNLLINVGQLTAGSYSLTFSYFTND